MPLPENSEHFQRPKTFHVMPMSPLSFYPQASIHQTTENLQAFVPVFYPEQNAGTVNVGEVWPLFVVLWQWLFSSDGSQCKWLKEGQWLGPRP